MNRDSLLRTEDGGVNRAAHPAILSLNQQIAWLSLTSESNGLALVDEADGSTSLYRSLDGRQNWSLLS